MGVIRCSSEGEGWQMLGFIGDESTIRGLSGKLRPRQMFEAEIERLGADASAASRIDTVDELDYLQRRDSLRAAEPGGVSRRS